MVQTVKNVVAFVKNAKILVAFLEAVEFFGERLEAYFPTDQAAKNASK